MIGQPKRTMTFTDDDRRLLVLGLEESVARLRRVGGAQARSQIQRLLALQDRVDLEGRWVDALDQDSVKMIG